MGFSIALFPGICLGACISACIEELQRFTKNGKQRDFSDWIQSFMELNEFLRAPYFMDLAARYDMDNEG